MGHHDVSAQAYYCSSALSNFHGLGSVLPFLTKVYSLIADYSVIMLFGEMIYHIVIMF